MAAGHHPGGVEDDGSGVEQEALTKQGLSSKTELVKLVVELGKLDTHTTL